MNPKQFLRWSRRIVLLCAMLFVLYIAATYGIMTLDSNDDALYPFIDPGETILVLKRGFGYEARRRVLYRLTLKGQEYMASGYIYAGPGDTILVTGPIITTPAGELSLEERHLSIWQDLGEYRLKDDEFLVANENVLSERPDARGTGFVRREDLLRRVLLGMDLK